MTQPFSWQSRIRFKDCDASGRIHYAAIFGHIEAAEFEFFRAAGSPWQPGEFSGNLRYSRVHAEVDFISALTYEDLVDIGVRVDRIGKTSYTFVFDVSKAGRPAARAVLTIVCMDIETQRSHPLPEDLLELLRQHHQRPPV